MKDCENLLKEAIEALDMYLNSGSKETRKEASEYAKKVWEKYYGVSYKNKNWEHKLKYGLEIKGFPIRVVRKMLEEQEKQGNIKDVTIFEKNALASIKEGGFNWKNTKNGSYFWGEVIVKKDFNLFDLKQN